MLNWIILMVATAAFAAGIWLVASPTPEPLASDPVKMESWRPVVGVVIVILTAIVIASQAEIVLP